MAATLDLLQRRRRWLLIAVAGISGYGVYRLYHLPSITTKRRKVVRLFDALVSLAEAAVSSSDTITLVFSDLNRFIRSDSNDLPSSLKQLSKLATSDEFTTSISSLSESVTAGIVRGFRAGEIVAENSSLSDRVLDKLFSPAGSGFASVVVGSFAKNLVLAFYSTGSPSGEPWWVQLIGEDKVRVLMGDCIERFVGTAIAVFLDRTKDINTYDQLFAGLTNPKHGPEVRNLLVSICHGAIETLVKTSHQVMTGSNSSQSRFEELSVDSKPMSSIASGKVKEDNGWVERVSSTLAVPSNKKFILDVTGRVTFETVKSFLDFLMWKMSDGARRSGSAIREEVVERGLEVMRYISAKSMVIIAVCLALCMKMMARMRVLMPA